MGASTTNPYRLLPSVDEFLGADAVRPLLGRVRRELLVGFVAEVLERWRSDIKAGELDADGVRERLERGDLLRSVGGRVEREEKSGLVRVINASGVVLHTGLGRAPVHSDVAAVMERTARTFGTLEVDRFSGRRNRRDDRLSQLACRLTGAEAAIVVNNNAAAVLLLLNTFAAGRETVVSRGELVEIGGSFRMPDVMERANTRLVEAGTTNRTRPEDFRRAANASTGLFLKVHTSNFRVVGFTEEIGAADLAALGAELEVPTAFDLGSGLIEEGCAHSLAPLLQEPLVLDAVKSGIDVVTFSGDKLLGGPQAGFLVGKHGPIELLRKNPMYRALRLDKVSIAGLEATLELYLAGRAGELPTRVMLTRTADELRPVAEELARELGALARLEVSVADDLSQPGSGSAPGVYLPSVVVRVRAQGCSTEELAAGLRAGEPAVFARIQEGHLLLDPRTLLPGDAVLLVEAFRALAS